MPLLPGALLTRLSSDGTGANSGEKVLRGRWLRLLQVLWSLFVICDFFLLVVSLPAFYQVLHIVCTGPIATCFISDQLLPQELIVLQQAGISLHAYALAVFCLDLVASLAFLLVGAVIAWRRAETVGYLLLTARVGDTFGKTDERLLTDLARQAGVAVYAVRLTTHLQSLSANLQQAREHLVTTREEERRRLRRDLHDGLGPALASLTFKVDAARNVLLLDHEKANRLLEAVRQQVQEAIANIRRLVYNLRPPALDELGLLSALREQTLHAQSQGLEVTLDAPPTLPPLSAAIEVAVYRIAQEALTNVARHAQAQHGLLQLSLDTDTLHLVILDDGKGIPVGHHIGGGLHAMHERASELRGSCTITAGPSGGTEVRITFPLGATRATTMLSAHDAAPQDHTSMATFET